MGNIYLLQIIGNWLSVLFVSFVSFVGIDLYDSTEAVQQLDSNVKSVTVVSEIVPYSTEYVFNEKKT